MNSLLVHSIKRTNSFVRFYTSAADSNTPLVPTHTQSSIRSDKLHQVDRVAADVAYFVARRHLGLVQLPREVDQTVDKAILNAGLRGRRLRLYGGRFVAHLRALTRTQTHGGVLQYQETMTKKTKQRKQKELNAVIDNLQIISSSSSTQDDLQSPHSRAWIQSEEAPGLQKISCSVEEELWCLGWVEEKTEPSYQELTTALFAATRFPGCYAACLRIFDEVKIRDPSFHPRRMLDFGSGLGTAIWSAQEVWKDSMSEVLAVEPSIPMAVLGRQIEKAQGKKEGFVHKRCLIKWIPRLPSMYGVNKKLKRKFDLVVGSYVLSEITNTQERRRIIRQLWENCKELLVLVEPGTPLGSANIQEARTMILEYERKKRRKLEMSLDLSGVGGDSEIQQRMESGGVHVFAPCPHDGSCPMEGRKMWCHFNQRFQRTRAQRVTKLKPESHVGPRDFQDERFSYVVLKRGWREEASYQEVKISPQFYLQIKPDDLEKEWTPRKQQRMMKEKDFFDGKLESLQSDQTLIIPPSSTADMLPITQLRSWPMFNSVELDPRLKFPEHLSEIKEVDWEVLDPKALHSTRLAASQWSRIIRHPRHRSGHVILDVCSSCDTKGCEGKLQRHIVARSDREKAIGDAAYIMAKKVKWGDLWPIYYNQNLKITDA